MNTQEELLNSLIMELRRGVVILGVLSQLHEPEYGYSLLQALKEKGFAIEAGTLYPLLRRLEKQDLLESTWDTTQNRPRKYYCISTDGKTIYNELVNEWSALGKTMAYLMECRKE